MIQINHCSALSMINRKEQVVEQLQSLRYWSVEDYKYMHQALALARQGAVLEEVPVGAVLVSDGQVIGEGFNKPITTNDPTAHAEIVALRCACQAIQNYRLPPDTTLYVTLEPCTMCFGALIHARLKRLVFATYEPRAGMVGSQLNLTDMDFYNHSISVNSGLLRADSQQMLKQFFKARRNKKKINKPA